MKYNEWRDELKNNLLGVSESERARVLDYYAEAYADRREAGFSEREIIEEFGAPFDAAQRILTDAPKAEVKSQSAPPAPAPAPAHTPTTAPAAVPVSPVYASQPAAAATATKPKKSNWRWIIPLICGAVVLFVAFCIVIPVKSACRAVNMKFDKEVFEATEDVTALNLTIDKGSVRTEFYEGEKIVIEYPVAEVYNAGVTEADGVLTYTAKLNSYPLFGSYNIPDAVIKMPKSLAADVTAKISAGSAYLASGKYNNINLTISAGEFKSEAIECTDFTADINAGSFYASSVTCQNLICDIDAGNIEIQKLTCDILNADIKAGAAEIGIAGAKSDYNITADCRMGSSNISSQTVESDKKIEITVDMGSIDVTFDN